MAKQTPTSDEDVSASGAERGQESESMVGQRETFDASIESPLNPTEGLHGAQELHARLGGIAEMGERLQDEILSMGRFLNDYPFVSMQRIAALRRRGMTTAQAVDYLAIEQCGYTQSEWAEATGRTRKAVFGNAKRGESVLNDEP